jgi:hypothetical protein
MTIAILAQRNAMATAYGVAAPYGALFTTDPGTTGSVVGEVTGGSPAYARKALTWGTAATSAVVSAATAFDVPSGATIKFAGVTASATAGTSDLRDYVAVANQAFASQGTYTLTATYTQS